MLAPGKGWHQEKVGTKEKAGTRKRLALGKGCQLGKGYKWDSIEEPDQKRDSLPRPDKERQVTGITATHDMTRGE
jgi:hypothetical protein